MTLSNILTLNFPNFYNLSLFICHLFIDGHFRTGHILHDPDAFPVGQLITEIQSICPHSIPWLSTDVIDPNQSRLLWKPDDRTDHILQLTFLNPDKLPKSIEGFKEFLAFYRLFVFDSTKELQTKQYFKSIETDSSALILYYDLGNNLFDIHYLSSNSMQSQKTIQIHEGKNLFNQTFEANERNWLLSIDHSVGFIYNESYALFAKFCEVWNSNGFSVNFLHSNLNINRMINLTIMPFESIINSSTWTHKAVEKKFQNYYRELVTGYEPIDQDISRNEKDVFSLDLNGILTAVDRKKNNLSLYPYHLIDLRVLFFYGDDFKRRKNCGFLSSLSALCNSWIILFYTLSAILLCVLRQKARLKRDGFTSTLIDVGIALIGGGNIRINHRLEKWFFGIVFIGMFLFNQIWQNALLYPALLLPDKTVNTFEELAKIQPPIFIGYSLKGYQQKINQMIRNKMGIDSDHMALRHLPDLVEKHPNSFATVIQGFMVEQMKITANRRGVDVLQQTLGSIQVPYYLRSNQYIPERLRSEIDKKTSSIMENGLHAFYDSFTILLQKVRGNKIIRPTV